MSGQKRSRDGDNREECSSSKKRSITKRTLEKWIAENDKSLQTLGWLHFETSSNREHVTVLKCDVSRFKKKLVSMRNFRPAFIDGATNIRASTFKDHVATTYHALSSNAISAEGDSKQRGVICSNSKGLG